MLSVFRLSEKGNCDVSLVWSFQVQIEDVRLSPTWSAAVVSELTYRRLNVSWSMAVQQPLLFQGEISFSNTTVLSFRWSVVWHLRGSYEVPDMSSLSFFLLCFKIYVHVRACSVRLSAGLFCPLDYVWVYVHVCVCAGLPAGLFCPPALCACLWEYECALLVCLCASGVYGGRLIIELTWVWGERRHQWKVEAIFKKCRVTHAQTQWWEVRDQNTHFLFLSLTHTQGCLFLSHLRSSSNHRLSPCLSD